MKIGLSTPSYVNEELFKSCAEAGIEALEISVNYERTNNLDYDKLKEWSKKYGVELASFHLPFWPFDMLDISSEALCDKTVKYLCSLIEKASSIGIDLFVIHASGEPIADNERKERMEIAKRSLFTLAEFAKKHCAKIAVEDLPRSCLGRNIEDMKELVSAHPDLKVCFDTNHLLGDDNIEFIHALGDKIVATHISDYDFVNERHWLPGEGKVDWQAVLNALKQVDYKGVWLYEMDFECPKTIIRDRNLVCADFVRNANEIFENREITVFSKPKENLGYWE